MTHQLTPTQVAELRHKIEAGYQVDQMDDGFWIVVDKDLAAINDNEHFEAMDAEAEMEAIIQDKVKAAMEAMDEEESGVLLTKAIEEVLAEDAEEDVS